jgi:hypothetical protein
MKKIIYFFAAIAMFASCRPDEALGLIDNFRLSLNTDIWNYRYSVLVTDDFGVPLQSGVTITLSGEDANKVFTEFGDQSFSLNANGELTFTVHPKMEPTEMNALNFNINFKKAGYESVDLPVRISLGQFNLSENVELYSFQSLKDKLGVDVLPATASNGELSGGSILGKRGQGSILNVVNKLNADSAYYDNNPVSVVLEDKAKFYYYQNQEFQRPRVPTSVVTLVDTAIINGIKVPLNRDSTIYGDTVWETRSRLVRLDYVGNEINIFTRFEGLFNPQTLNSRRANWSSLRNCETKYDGNGVVGSLLMRSAGIANTFVCEFKGLLDDGSEVSLFPNQGSVLYSMVIDPAALNPSSGAPWAVGDSVEVGFEYTRNGAKSRRLPILLAGNGEMRIQSNMKPRFVGYYEVMDFTTEYDITILSKSTLPDTNIVPDLENLRFSYRIDATLADGGVETIDYMGSYRIADESDAMDRQIKYSVGASSAQYGDDLVNGTFYSSVPVVGFKVYTLTAYWDKQLRIWDSYNIPASGQGSVSLFSPDYQDESNYELRTRYDIKVVCAASPDSTTLFPSASASSVIGGNQAFARLKDGRWDTRGISIGDTMSVEISYKDWTLDTAFVVEKLRTPVEYIDQTGLDVCNL